VLKALEERGLIDDRAFAQYWKDNRVRFKPKSARLIRLELKQVGISPELAGAVTELLDEESLAYDAAVRKARVLRSCSEEEFSKRLYNHLQRRGFADAVIRSVLRRLAEVHNANDE
jgi:regulatory protein